MNQITAVHYTKVNEWDCFAKEIAALQRAVDRGEQLTTDLETHQPLPLWQLVAGTVLTGGLFYLYHYLRHEEGRVADALASKVQTLWDSHRDAYTQQSAQRQQLQEETTTLEKVRKQVAAIGESTIDMALYKTLPFSEALPADRFLCDFCDSHYRSRWQRLFIGFLRKHFSTPSDEQQQRIKNNIDKAEQRQVITEVIPTEWKFSLMLSTEEGLLERQYNIDPISKELFLNTIEHLIANNVKQIIPLSHELEDHRKSILNAITAASKLFDTIHPNRKEEFTQDLRTFTERSFILSIS